MDVLPLSTNNALTPGSDLWVVPNKKHSTWAKTLDWYLNFQIAKSKHRSAQKISDNLKETLDKYQVPLPSVDTNPSKLLIATDKLLPNQKTLYLQYAGDLSSWLKQIEEIWSDLSSPSIRIFLPRGVTNSNFLQAWKQTSPRNEVLFVEDPS